MGDKKKYGEVSCERSTAGKAQMEGKLSCYNSTMRRCTNNKNVSNEL